MNTDRVAMVFGHPAHESGVLGMVRRWRPRILYLSRADSAGEENRETLSRDLLSAAIGPGRTTFLGMPERVSYERILAGDHRWYESYLESIVDWLADVRPTVLFTDAFEFFSVHHDLTSALAAVGCRRAGLEVDCYHLPLASNGSPDVAVRPYAELDRAGWGCRYLRLDADESAAKRRLLEKTARAGAHELAAILEIACEDRWRLEPYRPEPPPSVFAAPPPTWGWRTWEETGRRGVERGKYRETILFEEHFVPLVRALGVFEGVGAAAVEAPPH